MGLDKSSDTSGYIRHGHVKPAKLHRSGGSLHWHRPDTILCFRRIRASCGGAVHGGRLRRVWFHLMHVWRISIAGGCGWLAPSGSTGLDFVFLANKIDRVWLAWGPTNRATRLSFPDAAMRAEQSAMSRPARSIAPIEQEFVFSANKGLVWRRCAWWAIVMGPAVPAWSAGSQQSGCMSAARSVGVDQTRSCLFGE